MLKYVYFDDSLSVNLNDEDNFFSFTSLIFDSKVDVDEFKTEYRKASTRIVEEVTRDGKRNEVNLEMLRNVCKTFEEFDVRVVCVACKKEDYVHEEELRINLFPELMWNICNCLGIENEEMMVISITNMFKLKSKTLWKKNFNSLHGEDKGNSYYLYGNNFEIQKDVLNASKLLNKIVLKYLNKNEEKVFNELKNNLKNRFCLKII